MVASNGTLVGGGTGTFGGAPRVSARVPVKNNMFATPVWKPGVAAPSMMTGRVLPVPNTRTPGQTKIVREMR